VIDLRIYEEYSKNPANDSLVFNEYISANSVIPIKTIYDSPIILGMMKEFLRE
jgi:hypothetical protein